MELLFVAGLSPEEGGGNELGWLEAAYTRNAR